MDRLIKATKDSDHKELQALTGLGSDDPEDDDEDDSVESESEEDQEVCIQHSYLNNIQTTQDSTKLIPHLNLTHIRVLFAKSVCCIYL